MASLQSIGFAKNVTDLMFIDANWGRGLNQVDWRCWQPTEKHNDIFLMARHAFQEKIMFCKDGFTLQA